MAASIARLLVVVLVTFSFVSAAKSNKKGAGEGEDQKWKKKDVRDYTDADIERLYEQWEDADEDELEEDELPEWKREPPKVDMSKIKTDNPEDFLKASKKGRTLMMFATVAGDPTEAETEKISTLWHSSLFNANIETQRYVVGTNRVLFMCQDGSHAWDIKDFLIQQENCDSVEIEGQTYMAKGGKEGSNSAKKPKKNNGKGGNQDSKDKKKKKDSENDIKKKNKKVEL